MKKVILIGDSIRISYQPVVAQELRGVAEVWGPEMNGGNTVNVLTHLHDWGRRRRPDVVHVNTGLHDLRTDHYGGRETVVPIGHYRENVEHILRYLREQTDAVVIWATATPVNDRSAHETHAKLDDFDRYNADVCAFNAAAVEVAGRMDVPVNDLYAVIAEGDQAAWQKADGVHFTPEGAAVLGRAVADFIRARL
jgi:lysophospholipase L1-like esterase